MLCLGLVLPPFPSGFMCVCFLSEFFQEGRVMLINNSAQYLVLRAIHKYFKKPSSNFFISY